MLHCDVYDNKNLYVIFMRLKISFGLYLILYAIVLYAFIYPTVATGIIVYKITHSFRRSSFAFIAFLNDQIFVSYNPVFFCQIA